ncbi:competence protein CoiA [Xylocopilactobacillus apis]|uniref:Competence protein n=1 Tax=Xylocopilactobacillus apis TaxID=2932183 RepID=A0AAU9CX52_9LACO|nr:competence protein CoiA family protein [Xylocopilactobacillus apis]BDR55873.1 competence protein [Xylocopilactobacillus apis]
MIAGLNSKGELVYLYSSAQAQNIIEKKEQFFCPNCQELLKVCCGKKNKPYFKHLRKNFTPLNESKLHQAGKNLLYTAWNEEGFSTQKEKVIITEEGERRVDVFVKPSLAIEFQCSPISGSLLKQRNDFYRNQGWDSLWFLGPRYFVERKFNTNSLKFLNYQENLGFYLLFLEADRKNVVMYHHIRKYDWFRFWGIKEKCSINQLFNYRFGNNLKNYHKVSVKQTKRQFAQALVYRDRNICELQRMCYEKGYDLMSLPDELFVPEGFPQYIDQNLK